MAEPDDPFYLPTQPWSGPPLAEKLQGDTSESSPDPPTPSPRRARWQPPSPEELTGSFPQYEILSVLGCGGMGMVYQARQIALDRFVAIKLLPLEISVDREFADRFRREARAMAKLHHPNIVGVYDFGQTGKGQLYFVMEFVKGTNLQEIIRQVGLDVAQALSLVEQVCTALAYAHEKGIVHRDIKPANIMVSADGHVKVADFGLARFEEPTGETSSGMTAIGTVMGTPDYMAPEQKLGTNVDHRADIYALGVTLYEMLCRQVPHGNFPRPSERISCDLRIDQIVLKAMQQQPEMRYQSTAEMKAAVVAARTPLPGQGAPAPTPEVLEALRAFQASIGIEPRLIPAPLEIDAISTLPKEPATPEPPSSKMMAGLLAFAVFVVVIGSFDLLRALWGALWVMLTGK